MTDQQRWGLLVGTNGQARSEREAPQQAELDGRHGCLDSPAADLSTYEGFRAWVIASRASQGLPPHVQDPRDTVIGGTTPWWIGVANFLLGCVVGWIIREDRGGRGLRRKPRYDEPADGSA